MANVGVFDVLGPIMIGPSSSHTAGAARLGKMARTIVGKPIKEVNFLLHGSFRETYKGHGTDRALVAGILGMQPDDVRLRDALQIAQRESLKVIFTPADLGDVHPNTVKLIIRDEDENLWEIQGSSIGGGLIEINLINGNQVQLTGEYTTLITWHEDQPGTVARVSSLFYEAHINIAFMKLMRQQKGQGATMTVEVDGDIPTHIIEQIEQIEGISRVILINPLGGIEDASC